MFFNEVVCSTTQNCCNFDAFTTRVLFKSVYVSFHLDYSFIEIFMIDEKIRWRFFGNHNFNLKIFIFFSKSPNLASIILTFSQNSSLSLINSVWVDIRLSCSFILKPKNWSLIIFSNCFLVRVLLHCSKSFNSCRKTSGLYESAAVISSFISYQAKQHNKKIQ